MQYRLAFVRTGSLYSTRARQHSLIELLVNDRITTETFRRPKHRTTDPLSPSLGKPATIRPTPPEISEEPWRTLAEKPEGIGATWSACVSIKTIFRVGLCDGGGRCEGSDYYQPASIFPESTFMPRWSGGRWCLLSLKFLTLTSGE